MFPVVALIGQKNVGKSTLFNKLTHTHDALTSNAPGLTRDRQYGYFRCEQFKSILIDTGGIDGLCNLKIKGIQRYITYQTHLAIKEADIILFLIDGQSSVESINYDIINFLKKLKKNIFIVINKIDNNKYHKLSPIVWESYSYGINNIIFISAIHGYGIDNLLKEISLYISKDYIKFKSNTILAVNTNTTIFQKNTSSLCNNQETNLIITLAVVGPPNSGKSTFINNILGQNRMIACSIPGTTRNSVYTNSVVYDKQQYVLIDTAGVRKKKKIDDMAEQISVIKTFEVIKLAHIVLFMGDVNLGISDQDLYLLRFILNNSKTLIMVFNKWDKISLVLRNKIKRILCEKINFINFTQVHFISALYSSGVKALFKSIKETYFCSVKTISTTNLMHIMYAAIVKYPPPLLHGRKIKLKYVHIGGYNPLTLVIHGNYVSKLPSDYQRYLNKYFYKMLNLTGVILRIQFKDTVNALCNIKKRI